MNSAKPKLKLPDPYDQCYCGSGQKFKFCCSSRLPHFEIGKTVWKYIRAKDWENALLVARSDLTQYTIWHKTNTGPIISRLPDDKRNILDIDVDCIREYAWTVLNIYKQMGKEAEVPAFLERLRKSIDHPKWQRDIIVQLAHFIYYEKNVDAARLEFSKLGEITLDEDNVDILQFNIILNRKQIGLMDRLYFYDRIVNLSEDNGDKLQYMCAKGYELFMAGDIGAAAKAFDAALSYARGHEHEAVEDPNIPYWTCQILSGIIKCGGDKAKYNEIETTLNDMLNNNKEWTDFGKARLYQMLGDTYRCLGKREDAMMAFKHSFVLGGGADAKIFYAESQGYLDMYKEAFESLEELNVNELDESHLTDYIFTYAFLAIISKDLAALDKAEVLLKGMKQISPYFYQRQLEHLHYVQGAKTAIKDELKNPKSKKGGVLEIISRYLLLQPNIAGIGINLNQAIDDAITHRSPKTKDKPD